MGRVRVLTAVMGALTLAGSGWAQPRMVRPESLEQGFILVVKDESGQASAGSPIYLASNHTGWNPGNLELELSPQSDMRWRIVVPRPRDPSPMEFKFTRGSWDLVEVAADLSDIPNRTLLEIDASRLAAGEKPVFEFVIQKFADQRPNSPARLGTEPYRRIEVTGDVRRLQVVGGGPPIGPRDVLVWLPPGYDDAANASRRYPVLYLHDGQNVFEQLPGVPGEWRADETATKLIANRAIEPLIIVGIPHAGRERSSEYLPVRALEGVEPRGDEYVRWLFSEVIPRVERTFRVRTDRAGRAIGGSSLGAVISLHAAATHPDAFGGLLLESMPLLERAGSDWPAYLSRVSAWPDRVFIGMGGRETGPAPAQEPVNARYVAGTEALRDRIAGAIGAERVRLLIEPEAIHNEGAWASRLPAALEFLFPENP